MEFTSKDGQIVKVDAEGFAAPISIPVSDINLSEAKLKPFVAVETNFEILNEWLILELAKETPRLGVIKLINDRITKLFLII